MTNFPQIQTGNPPYYDSMDRGTAVDSYDCIYCGCSLKESVYQGCGCFICKKCEKISLFTYVGMFPEKFKSQLIPL